MDIMLVLAVQTVENILKRKSIKTELREFNHCQILFIIGTTLFVSFMNVHRCYEPLHMNGSICLLFISRQFVTCHKFLIFLEHYHSPYSIKKLEIIAV